MWYLTSENDNRIIYIVPPVEIVIGRSVDAQVCNFAVPDDPSISRKHATLMVLDNNLVVRDSGSRYGTFINDSDEKIEINTDIRLNNNDVVKFGKMNSIWKVHAVTHITCTSTLKGENLQNLKSVLSNIGGVFKGDWDDTCNYLTMPAITLTIKVVLALVQGSYIVTTEFWNKCLEAVNSLTPLPDPKKFTPQVVESTLNKEIVSFLPDARRKSLFIGKKFVFLSRRQFEMYKTVLAKCSASPLLLSELKMTMSMLCEENVIVIQYSQVSLTQETQTQRNQINDIINHLKNKGKRVVADAEIGLAILYCSTQKYCNPDFSFTSEVVKGTSVQNNKTSNILAPESQDTAEDDEKKENIVINESLMMDKTNLDGHGKISSKRKLNEITSEFPVNPNKKLATSLSAEIPNESTKRKLLDDDDKSNPSKKLALTNKNDDEGLFNFVNANTARNDNDTKTLNLLRPQKRKMDSDKNDGLFNFVQNDEEQLPSKSSKDSMFTIDKKKHDDTTAVNVKIEPVTTEDIAAMRGIKLKELMESNLSYNSILDYKVKMEKVDDLEEKMNGLDLGCTIVITSNDLIVKKEPVEVQGETTSIRNFKKFKKVWPLKKQVTIIPVSSMSIVA